MWAKFYLRNIALSFFSLGCSLFLRTKVYKKGIGVQKPSPQVPLMASSSSGQDEPNSVLQLASRLDDIFLSTWDYLLSLQEKSVYFSLN